MDAPNTAPSPTSPPPFQPPLVLAPPSRLRGNGEQLWEALSMISKPAPPSDEQPREGKGHHFRSGSLDEFVGDDAWREERDRLYVEESQRQWKAMTDAEILRDGGGIILERPPPQRKSDQRRRGPRKESALYPKPAADDMRFLSGKK